MFKEILCDKKSDIYKRKLELSNLDEEMFIQSLTDNVLVQNKDIRLPNGNTGQTFTSTAALFAVNQGTINTKKRNYRIQFNIQSASGYTTLFPKVYLFIGLTMGSPGQSGSTPDYTGLDGIEVIFTPKTAQTNGGIQSIGIVKNGNVALVDTTINNQNFANWFIEEIEGKFTIYEANTRAYTYTTNIQTHFNSLPENRYFYIVRVDNGGSGTQALSLNI